MHRYCVFIALDSINTTGHPLPKRRFRMGSVHQPKGIP